MSTRRIKVRAPGTWDEPPAQAQPSGSGAPLMAHLLQAVGLHDPMRDVGDVSRAVWDAELAPDSPIRSELDAFVRNASPHGALCLSQVRRESSDGKASNARATRNPLGLMIRGSNPSRLQSFDRWADAAAEFSKRVSDPSPPYDPRGISLLDYFLTYVGGPLCRSSAGRTCANGESRESIETYANLVLQDVARYKRASDTGEPPPPDPWRPMPYPSMVDLVVEKPASGMRGFDDCAFRRPLIRGFATHITDGPGTQTIEDIANYFGPRGARWRDALTDLVIGQDGRIGIMNDWRDPKRGGHRAGWANGGTNGLEGDGVAFYRAFPLINVHLVSCEHCAKEGERWSDAMIDATIRVRAALMQEMRVPWDSYPFHPAWGVRVEQQHRNFATKRCPSNPYINTYDAIVLRGVKDALKEWQGGRGNVPTPTPQRAYGEYQFPEEMVARDFGILTAYRNGKVDKLPYDPNGPISAMWLRRCLETGFWPEAEEMRQVDTGLDPDGPEWIVAFEGGWRLWAPVGKERAGWSWLDGWQPKAA